MKLYNIGIIGMGSYVPERILTNEMIDEKSIGTNSKWTKNKIGIEERHISLLENTSDLAYKASLIAIKDALIDKNEIDLTILATSSPDRLSPSTACIVIDKLGIKCPALDINAVCSGFVYGIQLASSLINTKQYKNILVVASETYSKITNWEDRNCIFFGDGAGAIILSETNGGWITTDLYGDGVGKDVFTCKHGSFFEMNGKMVYDFGTKILPTTIKNSLAKNNLTVSDISWLIPHQPSIQILIKTAEILSLPLEKVVMNMKNYGNTAGASIPMALDKIYKEKKLENDNILVMAAIGSGWTWGVTIMKYFK